MKLIMQAVVFCIGAAVGVGLTLAAQRWLPEPPPDVFSPFEPSQPIFESHPRQAALWDGSCPIKVDPVGLLAFEGVEHLPFEPRNALGDFIGFRNVLLSAADMGDRDAIKCVLIYHWFDGSFETPQVFYEYLWLAHDYGLTAPYQWWADTHNHLTPSLRASLRARARRKFEEASAYFAQSRSKRGFGADPEMDSTPVDVKQAEGKAFFDEIAAEISRLEALQHARAN
ncbi:MAG: hypothetical protein AAF719_13985 [Pseudomonadota bacterium]